jgi:hypothetical protein
VTAAAPPPVLHQVRIGSPEVSRHRRDEVADRAVAEGRALLSAALGGGRQVIPGVPPGYALDAHSFGWRCVRLVIWGRSEPLVTQGIAADGWCGISLWRALHDEAALRRAPSKPPSPPEPWFATRPEKGGQGPMGLAAQAWLATLHLVLAWALIESRP